VVPQSDGVGDQRDRGRRWHRVVRCHVSKVRLT
jgi:hypothetical protein